MDDVNAAASKEARELGQWIIPGLVGSFLYVTKRRPKTPLQALTEFFSAFAVTLMLGPFLREFIPNESRHLVPALGLGIGFSCMFFVGELYTILDTKLAGALGTLSDALVERLKRLAGVGQNTSDTVGEESDGGESGEADAPVAPSSDNSEEGDGTANAS